MGVDLVFLLCMATATDISDHCRRVHLQIDGISPSACLKLAPEVIADWIGRQGRLYDGYAIAKFTCLPPGTSLGDDA